MELYNIVLNRTAIAKLYIMHIVILVCFPWFSINYNTLTSPKDYDSQHNILLSVQHLEAKERYCFIAGCHKIPLHFLYILQYL